MRFMVSLVVSVYGMCSLDAAFDVFKMRPTSMTKTPMRAEEPIGSTAAVVFRQ